MSNDNLERSMYKRPQFIRLWWLIDLILNGIIYSCALGYILYSCDSNFVAFSIVTFGWFTIVITLKLDKFLFIVNTNSDVDMRILKIVFLALICRFVLLGSILVWLFK